MKYRVTLREHLSGWKMLPTIQKLRGSVSSGSIGSERYDVTSDSEYSDLSVFVAEVLDMKLNSRLFFGDGTSIGSD